MGVWVSGRGGRLGHCAPKGHWLKHASANCSTVAAVCALHQPEQASACEWDSQDDDDDYDDDNDDDEDDDDAIADREAYADADMRADGDCELAWGFKWWLEKRILTFQLNNTASVFEFFISFAFRLAFILIATRIACWRCPRCWTGHRARANATRRQLATDSGHQKSLHTRIHCQFR